MKTKMKIIFLMILLIISINIFSQSNQSLEHYFSKHPFDCIPENPQEAVALFDAVFESNDGQIINTKIDAMVSGKVKSNSIIIEYWNYFGKPRIQLVKVTSIINRIPWSNLITKEKEQIIQIFGNPSRKDTSKNYIQYNYGEYFIVFTFADKTPSSISVGREI